MFRILCGILCFMGIINASEYIFSYRIAVKNGIILNEKYDFSPSMVSANMLKQTKHPYKSCEISHNAKSEKALLKDYKTKMVSGRWVDYCIRCKYIIVCVHRAI